MAKAQPVTLRDVSQAYVQFTTVLKRNIFVRPPKESNLSEDSILRVVRPLYGMSQAGNHWFSTYHKHHTENLQMANSPFDPCLLHTSLHSLFGVVGLQTDDTLFAANDKFARLENEKLKNAKIDAKPCEKLTSRHPLNFNGGNITKNNNTITISQSRQCEKIKLLVMGCTPTGSGH
ncbi:hypothetical protein K3495_g11622 [Podosphaera aphanis]|nr:hypothetical protein K3495_g11622 [Podosphaera aphanis]